MNDLEPLTPDHGNEIELIPEGESAQWFLHKESLVLKKMSFVQNRVFGHAVTFHPAETPYPSGTRKTISFIKHFE